MKFPRVTGLTLVIAGILGMAAGLALPWARTGTAHPDGGTLAGLALLGPVLSLARLLHRRYDAVAPTAAAAIAALASAGLAGIVAQEVDPTIGVGLGGPFAIAGALTITAGWLFLIVNRPAAVSWPVIVAAVVTALVIALDGTGIYWFVEGRFVDASTAAAPAAPPGAPTLTSQRWQRTVPATALVGVTHHQAVVRGDQGVAAFATATGTPTWHYRRTDAVALAAGIVADDVVTVFSSTEGLLVTAHDAATGRQRFAQRYAGKTWHPGSVESTPDGRLAVLTGSGTDPGDVVAIDARTGHLAWTWTPAQNCDINGAATSATQLALALRCRADGVKDEIVALSTADGKQAWTWPVDYAGVTRGDEPTIAAGFLVRYGTAPRHSILLDDTGAGVKHAGPGGLATVTATLAVYYSADFNGGHLTAITTADGKQAWQTPVSWLLGWQLVGGASTPGAVYVLLTTLQPEAATGPLRLLRIDPGSGTVTGDGSGLSCNVSCLATQLSADQTSVVIGTRVAKSADLALTAPG